MDLLLSDPNGLYVAALKCKRSHPVPPLIIRVHTKTTKFEIPISDEPQYQEKVCSLISCLRDQGLCNPTTFGDDVQIGDEVEIHGLSSALWNGR